MTDNPRTAMRLPQLGKYHRRMRSLRRSEFIVHCENLAFQEDVRRDRVERLRREEIRKEHAA